MSSRKTGYFVAFNRPDGLYLNYGGDGLSISFSKKKLLKDISDMYNTRHARNYESSMSACIHFISLQPIVIKLPNDPDLVMEYIEKTSSGGMCVYSLDGIASRGTKGLKIKPELAQELIDFGTSADLINEDFNDIMIKKEKGLR